MIFINNPMIKKVLLTFILCLSIFIVYIFLVTNGLLGRYESPGIVTKINLPSSFIESKTIRQLEATKELNIGNTKQILFGDLHVHTTYSADAFLMSLPMLSGEGTHPPADACDFARFCSSLDFWANTDHAEDLNTKAWKEIVSSVRSCNKVSDLSGVPDLVAFLGWEWSNIGGYGLPHYGHKNVIFKDIEDENIPSRPIGSEGLPGLLDMDIVGKTILSATRPFDTRVHDLMRYIKDRHDPKCPKNIAVRDLPLNCKETAATPGDLFDKLNDWGHETIVIPHGTTWGNYTPPESTWESQLTDEQQDPYLQILVEVYSGHGNSEEFRNWTNIDINESGFKTCPKKSYDYLPGCWRAGEIIQLRCLSEGISSIICLQRAEKARKDYVNAGIGGHFTVPGEKPFEWLDANQCKDCFLPSFNYRPKGSAQYMLALRNFNKDQYTERFKFGFIGSSDVHSGRPGTGYKEFSRKGMTEAIGPADIGAQILGVPDNDPPISSSISKIYTIDTLPKGTGLIEVERISSFFHTGGLVAVHSDGRDRDSIWRAIKKKEVYATSGPRILLWFNLINSPSGDSINMGSEVKMKENPRFLIRAMGSLKQITGCPSYSVNSLDPSRLESLCKGECYNPSDIRRKISRLEVIRIRPQVTEDEIIEIGKGKLIEDPWKVIDCIPDELGCVASFSDPDFDKSKRDTVYYVRALEEPSMIINSGNLRCKYNDLGECIKVNICSGSILNTPKQDECFSRDEERAWSSPIFVDYDYL